MAGMLKKSSFGDILDQTVRTYISNFSLFASISLWMLLPGLLTVGLPFLLSPYSRGVPEPFSGPPVPMLLAYAVYGLAGIVVSGAVTRAAAERHFGNATSARDALIHVKERFGRLLGGFLLYVLAIVVGFLLFFVPGLYLTVAYTFVVPVIVIEGLTVRKSFGRSRLLVKGSWWRVLGLELVVGLLAAAVQYALGSVFLVLSAVAPLIPGLGAAMAFASQAGLMVVGTILAPVQIIGTTIIYYDQRIRKEGLDLWVASQTLAEDVEEPQNA